MKILITGVSGFVGKFFCTKLLNNYLKGDNEVYFLMHNRLFNLDIKSSNKNKLKIISGDISDSESIKSFFSGIDLVIHMAAMVKYGGFNKNDYFRVNVIGTENVLKLSYLNKIKKVIVLSTAAIYHPMYDKYISENSFSSGRCVTNYTRTKLQAYQIVKKYRKMGLNIISILPSSVFGYESPLFEPLILFCLKFRFVFLPKHRGRLSIISINNLSKFIFFCMFNGLKNKDYFLSDMEISLKSFVKEIEKTYRKKIIIISVPNIIMRSFMLFWELFRRCLRLDMFFNFELFKFIDGNFLVKDNTRDIVDNFNSINTSNYYDFHEDMQYIINKYKNLYKYN